MADIVVPAVLEGLIKLLTNNEPSFRGEVKDQVCLLQDDLRIMNAFLKDSAGKRSGHHLVQVVVEQIEEASLQAEDVIDAYIAEMAKQKSRNFLAKLLYSIGHRHVLNVLAKKTTSIKNQIQNIYENRATFNISQDAFNVNTEVNTEIEQALQNRRKRVEEDDVVGFLHDTAILVSQLTDLNNSYLRVISIIGMGGLGKTTLARKIYNDTRVRNHFDCCAWVFVSQEYTIRSLFLDVLKSFMSISDEIHEMSDQKLKETLFNYLKNQRYFIVLDDIWKTQVWDELKNAFPDNSNGSRILITSREKEAAAHASNSITDPYRLPFLDNDTSWELLCKKVFRGEKCPSNLENLGMKLAESCKGLPLSIVVLGGILANKEKSHRMWSNFIGHVNSFLTEDRADCLDILALSYNHLPHYLKPCFLYLGMFPEDYRIETHELIQLWVAEGFVKQIGNRKADDVAEFYLEELIDRSLIQVASWRSDGRVKTCHIHDLLRDLCIKESVKEKFLEVHSEANLAPRSKPRKLSVHCDSSPYVSWERCDRYSSVRSMVFFCQVSDFQEKQWKWLLEGFKFIQVLSLLDVDKINSIPDEIEKLFFLRYLRIGNKSHKTPSIRKIPDSICNLPYLETINIDLLVLHLYWPRNIWRMKRLRYLHTCNSMRLPEPLSDNYDTLYNLRVLFSITVDQKTALVISKSKLPNLRELGLSNSQKKGVSNFEATQILTSLEGLRHLQRLRLSLFPKCEPSLKCLPSTLTELTLWESYVDSHLMGILGKLPNLRQLEITSTHTKFPPELNFGGGEFLQLLDLRVRTYGIEKWEMDKDAMPNLQCLLMSIGDSKMQALPDQLWSMKDLRHVELWINSASITKSLRKLECIKEERDVEASGMMISHYLKGPVCEFTMNRGCKVLVMETKQRDGPTYWLYDADLIKV